MMIKIRSIYDLKTFKAFQKYSLFKIFILGYICALLFIGVGIWFAFVSRSSYIVYLLSGILLPVLLHVFYRMMEMNALNKNRYLRDTTIQLFSFDEEGFELEQISNYDVFKERYTYNNVLSVVKYKRYYFIYINRVQAFVINNLDYMLGNENELDELFLKLMKKRFIVKKNSKKKPSL